MPRFYSGSWTTQESLIQAVDTVLTDAAGLNWTQDELDTTNDEAGWNDGAGLFIQASWDNTADINFYQSTAWDGAGTAPGAHTGDSGSDHVVRDIGDSGVEYFAFTNDGTGPDFAYFVIEYTAGFYRHFGFGHIDKHGGWTDGQFVYGHEWNQSTSFIDVPNSSQHSILFDGNYSVTNSPEAATIRITGTEWPNAPASSIWGVGSSNATLGNDTGGNGRYRCLGGPRRGFFVQKFGFDDSSSADAVVPASPVEIIAIDPNYSAPAHGMWMGELPLVYVGNMSGYTDEEQITVGSETWQVFPIVNSSFTGGSDLEQSGNGGVFYRRA